MKTETTIEDRIRSIEADLEASKPEPIQKLRWERERDERIEREQYLDDLTDEMLDYRETLACIADLSMGSTAACDLAIEASKNALKRWRE